MLVDAAFKAFAVVRRNDHGCVPQPAARFQFCHEVAKSAVSSQDVLVVRQSAPVNLALYAGLVVGLSQRPGLLSKAL
jgi:hypothetical protein